MIATVLLGLFLDVMVLNDIINQAALRGSVDATAVSSSAAAASTPASRRASRKISMYLDSGDGIGEEGPRLKERMMQTLYRLIDIFCVWDCCRAYIRLSEVRPVHIVTLQNST